MKTVQRAKDFLAKGLFFAVLLSGLPLYSQEQPDFGGIQEDLGQLERLIGASLREKETQEAQLQALKENLSAQEALLSEKEASIQAQDALLTTLRTQLAEMSSLYKTRSELSARYERKSKFWRTFSLISLPTAAIISAALTSIYLR